MSSLRPEDSQSSPPPPELASPPPEPVPSTSETESSTGESAAESIFTSVPSRPPSPDRDACKKKARRTPNGQVWAHRVEDLVQLDDEFWSPSMVEAADEAHTYDPSFREKVYGLGWKMPDEPEPRRLRPWPVLTMAEGISCPEELMDLKDVSVTEDGIPDDDEKTANSGENNAENEEKVKDKDDSGDKDETRTDGGGSLNNTSPLIKDATNSVGRITAESTASDEKNANSEPERNTNDEENVNETKDEKTDCGGSSNDIPKLEQRIPTHLLPEILIVRDPKNRTGKARAADEVDLKYRRVYPKPASLSDGKATSSTAHLELPLDLQSVGQGSHANVYHAHLTLDKRFALIQHPPTSKGSANGSVAPSTTVRVVAKLNFHNLDDEEMLSNEAMIYDAMPSHLSEVWSGFNAIGESRTDYTDGRVPATAIVPKFYGYFVPVEESCRRSAVLLLEECGRPIDARNLTKGQRSICFAFPSRLNTENFLQISFYERNIVVQPGPLTHPPHLRSLDTPSFRLIDFGRGECLDLQLSDPERNRDRTQSEWETSLKDQTRRAMRTIFGEEYKYREKGQGKNSATVYKREFVVDLEKYERSRW